jgi:hypothetical protein
MKKLFYFLLTAAAGLALASCVKEPMSVPDPAQGGEPVPVSFSVNLGDALTKAAPEASDFDNASGEFKLYAAAFSKTTGALISTSKIGGSGYQPVETVTAKNVNVVLTLSRSQDYKVVFFAMHDGAYEVNFADNNVATFSYKRSLKANDASLDAFYATVDVSAGTKQYDVTMKRPFAQLNVLVPTANVPAGQTAFSSSMTVQAPLSFNLFSGAAGTDVQEIAFASNAIAATPVGNYKTTHKWIGMNFILVPASGKVTVSSFAESGMSEAVQIGSVPVKVNSRTNIVGNIYSLTDYFFNVTTDSSFADEGEVTLDNGENGQGGQGGGGGETPTDTVVEIAGGNTYTETAPFAIDASNPSAPNKITLTVNGGHTFAEINAGAAQGQQVTATSSDATVATAAVSGNEIVITPVGNGKAKITVSIPAYTKASYGAKTFDFWVEVSGKSSGGGEGGGSDTIVFADLNLENGTQYKDAFTQGNMSVQFGSGTNDGKYYTTGAGMRIYGDGWVTVSSQKTIVKIEYTFDPSEQKDGDVVKTFIPDQATFGSVDTGSYDLATQTWTGSAKSVKLTRATGTGHWRLQQVKVYYADGQGGGGETTTVTATLDVSPASLNLTVGGTATITASTNSTAKPTFVSSNTSVADVDANGLVTAKAAGTATITVSVAAVEGAFTAASKTVPVTVAAAGGGTGEETKVTLTNEEIKAATVNASMAEGETHYGDVSIASTSGTWTGNIAQNKGGLNYLQIRNKKGAYLKSPVFSSNIKKIVVTITNDASVTLYNRALYAVPASTSIPTGDDLYTADVWASKYGTAETGTTKGATVTIEFTGDTKQFTLVVGGGATYIDQIEVYY